MENNRPEKNFSQNPEKNVYCNDNPEETVEMSFSNEGTSSISNQADDISFNDKGKHNKTTQSLQEIQYEETNGEIQYEAKSNNKKKIISLLWFL